MKMMSKSNLSMKSIYLWLASLFWSIPGQEKRLVDDLAESSGDESEESGSEEDEEDEDLEEEEQWAWSEEINRRNLVCQQM